MAARAKEKRGIAKVKQKEKFKLGEPEQASGLSILRFSRSDRLRFKR